MKMIWLLAISVLAQGSILLGWESLETTLLAAVAVALLWRVRSFLPSHADMLILMAAMGGLGMLLPVLAGAPACHLDGHRAGMYLGMILLPAWPCFTNARCVLEARRQGWAHWLVLGDLAGMVVGMEAASLLARGPGWLHHVVMLIGMLLGMGVSMAIAVSIRRANLKSDSRGQAIAGSIAQAVGREESPVSLGQRAG